MCSDNDIKAINHSNDLEHEEAVADWEESDTLSETNAFINEALLDSSLDAAIMQAMRMSLGDVEDEAHGPTENEDLIDVDVSTQVSRRDKSNRHRNKLSLSLSRLATGYKNEVRMFAGVEVRCTILGNDNDFFHALGEFTSPDQLYSAFLKTLETIYNTITTEPEIDGSFVDLYIELPNLQRIMIEFRALDTTNILQFYLETFTGFFDN